MQRCRVAIVGLSLDIEMYICWVVLSMDSQFWCGILVWSSYMQLTCYEHPLELALFKNMHWCLKSLGEREREREREGGGREGRGEKNASLQLLAQRIETCFSIFQQKRFLSVQQHFAIGCSKLQNWHFHKWTDVFLCNWSTQTRCPDDSGTIVAFFDCIMIVW